MPDPTEQLQVNTDVLSVRYSFDDEFMRLNAMLGRSSESLPGDITLDADGDTAFAEGELNDTVIIERVGGLLKDGKVESLREAYEVRKADNIDHALRAWQGMESGAEAEDPKLDYRREYILGNQAAEFHEYVPEVVQQVLDVTAQYRRVRMLADKFNIPISQEVIDQEHILEQYLAALEEAMAERVAFENARMARWRLRLHDQAKVFPGRIQTLERKQRRSDTEEMELVRLRNMMQWIEAQGVQDISRDQLVSVAQKAYEKVTPEQWEALESDDDEKRAVSNHALDQRILDILTGKKEATGLEDDFVPQMLYVNLWKQTNAGMLDLQTMIEKEIAKDPENTPAEAKEFLRQHRSALVSDLVCFSHDIGVFQVQMAEIAAIQGQFGKEMYLDDLSPTRKRALPTTEKLEEWLEQRRSHRYTQLRNGLEVMEENVTPGPLEIVEDMSNKQWREAVRNISHRMATVAASWVPSEESGVLGGAYRYILARPLGLPESSESLYDDLAGPFQEALGWPEGKTEFSELTPEEQAIVMHRARSVLDAMNDFDKQAIQDLRSSMNLVESLPPPSSYGGQQVDAKIVEAMEGLRVTKDMTGETVAGKKVNGATAYILALRQVRKDWGDPEQGTGYIGQYKQFLESVDDVIDVHLDVEGALYRQQVAWMDYAGDILKLAGAAAIAPWVIAALAFLAGSVGIPAVRFTGHMTMRAIRGSAAGARGLASLRNARMPQSLGVLTRSKEALARMAASVEKTKFFHWLNRSKAGRFINNLKFVKNARIGRAGGRVFRFGMYALIPAVAYYEVSTNKKRIDAAKGNKELQEQYKSENTDTYLEAGGAAATLFVSTGPAIVLLAPVVWSREYARGRAEVKASWIRGYEDWARENDSAGLRQKLTDVTLTNSVESGGGGALSPRIYYPESLVGFPDRYREDQEEAIEAIAEGDASSRGLIYEAYFWKNLTVPPGATEQDAKTAVNRKTSYIKMVSGGDYASQTSHTLRQADVYEELLRYRDLCEQTGRPTMMDYEDNEGKEQYIDLSKLTPGTGSKSEIMTAVNKFMNHLQPVQELVLFNTMSALATESNPNREQREKAMKNSDDAVRRIVRGKFSHHLYRMEMQIRAIDWPGVGSGNTATQNIVREYIKIRLENEMDEMVPKLLSGDVSMEKYKEWIKKLQIICGDLNNLSDVDAYAEKARRFLAGRRMDVERIKTYSGETLNRIADATDSYAQRRLAEWLKIKETTLTPDDAAQMLRGLKVLAEGTMLENGIIRYNADSKEGVRSLFYNFRPGMGWRWSPDGDHPATGWRSVNSGVNVSWEQNGRKRYGSPTGPNVGIIMQLREA